MSLLLEYNIDYGINSGFRILSTTTSKVGAPNTNSVPYSGSFKAWYSFLEHKSKHFIEHLLFVDQNDKVSMVYLDSHYGMKTL